MMEALLAVAAALFAVFGIGVAVVKRRNQPTPEPAPAPARKVAEAKVVQLEERRAARGSELTQTLSRIHTETRAAVASRKADRQDAERLLKEARAWDDGSDL